MVRRGDRVDDDEAGESSSVVGQNTAASTMSKPVGGQDVVGAQVAGRFVVEVGLIGGGLAALGGVGATLELRRLDGHRRWSAADPGRGRYRAAAVWHQ
jgi:hypothetical protein